MAHFYNVVIRGLNLLFFFQVQVTSLWAQLEISQTNMICLLHRRALLFQFGASFTYGWQQPLVSVSLKTIKLVVQNRKYLFNLCNLCKYYFFILVIYTLFSSSDEGKLYLNPEVVTPWFSFFFTSNLLYNLAWIFVWDREQIVGASILLFLIAKTNIISLAILARNIAKDGHQLREDKPKIYW